MRKISTILLLMALLTNVIAQQHDAFVVKGNMIDSNLKGHIYTTKNLSFNRIEELILLKNQFKKIEEPLANFGVSNDNNWIKLELENGDLTDKQLVLFLDQTFLEKADFYQFQGDSLIQKIELNQAIKPDNRPLKNQNFAFPFELKSKQQSSIFLRIKADSIYGISRALVRLSDKDNFHKTLRHNNLSFGILIGFLSFSFFVGILLFYFGKKIIYAIYGIYILSFLCYYLCNNGYFNALSANTFLGSARFSHLNLWISSALHLFLIHKFLDLKKQFSKPFRYFVLGLIYLSVLLAFSYICLPIPLFFSYFSRIILLIIGSLIIFLAVWGIIKKQQKTLLYSLAVFPSILLIIYFALSALRILPLYSVSFSLAFPFSVFEIIVVGIGLVFQFNEEKNAIERKLNEERAAVAAQIISAQEQERQRISQDLHDDLGSTLSMLKYKLAETNEKVDNRLINEIEIASKALDDLRLISYNLTPSLFLQKGLMGALKEFIVLNKTSDTVEFIYSGNERRFEWEIELSILRIAKELLNNAIKHAKATKIELQLIYFKNFLYLSVEDNGMGILKNKEKSEGIGLKNINLRVNYLKGKINQESSEKGTLISIEIPYEPDLPN